MTIDPSERRAESFMIGRTHGGTMLVYSTSMGRQPTRKITVEVPVDVLERATAQGEGITDVVRRSLELRANQQAWKRLERWAGKVKWSVPLKELRRD